MISVPEALRLALQHVDKGDYDEAEIILRKILALLPDSLPACHLLGLVAYRTGRLELAIHLFDKARGVGQGAGQGIDQGVGPIPDPLRNNLAAAHNTLARKLEAEGLTEAAARQRRLARQRLTTPDASAGPDALAGPEPSPAGPGPDPDRPARDRITVVLCGQVRHPWFFRKAARIYLQMLHIGMVDRFILSTWEGELAPHGDLERRLRHYGVEIVYNKPVAGHQVSGNYMQQTKQLYNALLEVESDSWVFKTRPDVFMTFDNVEGLFRSVLDAPPPDVEPKVFERRVWVPYFEATQPFFISDVAFLGRRDDLLKLCNFDMGYEVNGTFDLPDPLELQQKAAAAETRKYLNLFALHYPILNEYKETWQYAEYYKQTRENVLNHNFSSHLYWEYVALSLYILRQFFLVGRPHYDGKLELVREVSAAEGESFEFSGSNHFVNCVDSNLFYDNLRYYRNPAGQVFCNDSVWLDNLFAGRIRDPYLGYHLHECLASALAYRNTPERRRAFALYKAGLRKAAGYE